jgi:hypothetical protein
MYNKKLRQMESLATPNFIKCYLVIPFFNILEYKCSNWHKTLDLKFGHDYVFTFLVKKR